jgi:hypothetical protein
MAKKFYLNIFLLISYLQNISTRQFAFLTFSSIFPGVQNSLPVNSFQFPVLDNYKQFV